MIQRLAIFNFRLNHSMKNKIPVNSKCPCGTGKKYKKCCMYEENKIPKNPYNADQSDMKALVKMGKIFEGHVKNKYYDSKKDCYVNSFSCKKDFFEFEFKIFSEFLLEYTFCKFEIVKNMENIYIPVITPLLYHKNEYINEAATLIENYFVSCKFESPSLIASILLHEYLCEIEKNSIIVQGFKKFYNSDMAISHQVRHYWVHSDGIDIDIGSVVDKILTLTGLNISFCLSDCSDKEFTLKESGGPEYQEIEHNFRLYKENPTYLWALYVKNTPKNNIVLKIKKVLKDIARKYIRTMELAHI